MQNSTATNFHLANNKRKAVYSLGGILQGLVSDQQLNEAEFLFLDTWLRSQKHLRDDPDCIDLLDLVTDILKDGKIDADEMEDLTTLISDIIEYKVVNNEKDSDLVNECLGIISGIAADDILKEEEVNYLINWLSDNKHLLDTYPISAIVEALQPYTERELTNKEAAELLALFKQITGTQFMETGSTDVHPLHFVAVEPEDFNHDGLRICFTGTFDKGTRKEVEAIAQALGATTKKDVSKSIDCVIIGTHVSPDWISTSYGRKIQKAIELRDSGHPLVIMTEKYWTTHI